MAVVLRRWIIAFTVFFLDTTAAGPRTFPISSPCAPLAIHWLEISAGDAFTSKTPFVLAAGGSISPRHVLGTTLTSVRCGAPQSPAHCLANNQPTAQFTSILKQYVCCVLFRATRCSKQLTVAR